MMMIQLDLTFSKNKVIFVQFYNILARRIKMKYHKDGTKPKSGQVFVFGSNMSGIHGAGAAREAYLSFGAEYYNGYGSHGRSYAIPTKDHQIKTLPLSDVKYFVDVFLNYAKCNPETEFWITAIGCGLAGFDHSVIAPLFAGATDNCNFPDAWKAILEPKPEVKVEALKIALREGEVYITFKKVDGSIRNICGTLDTKLIPSEQLPGTSDQTRKQNPDIIAIFDTDLQGWRSFKVENLMSWGVKV